MSKFGLILFDQKKHDPNNIYTTKIRELILHTHIHICIHIMGAFAALHFIVLVALYYIVLSTNIILCLV